MNVFVLNTGRCGSTTFERACSHIENYTSAHESRSHILGPSHFDYPEQHIEIDNRLTWHLGRLGSRFGDDAVYVHLTRNREDTITSFVKRYQKGVIKAHRKGMMMGLPKESDPREVAGDYCDTVYSNIEYFLRDKTKKMHFSLENPHGGFVEFWNLIGAEGDMEAALAEFDKKYNATSHDRGQGLPGYVRRKIRKLRKRFA